MAVLPLLMASEDGRSRSVDGDLARAAVAKDGQPEPKQEGRDVQSDETPDERPEPFEGVLVSRNCCGHHHAAPLAVRWHLRAKIARSRDECLRASSVIDESCALCTAAWTAKYGQLHPWEAQRLASSASRGQHALDPYYLTVQSTSQASLKCNQPVGTCLGAGGLPETSPVLSARLAAWKWTFVCFAT